MLVTNKKKYAILAKHLSQQAKKVRTIIFTPAQGIL